MKKRYLLVALLVANAAARPAHAQLQGIGGATVTGDTKNARVPFGGLSLDFAFYNSSGLNQYNYSNTFDFFFFPGWSVGRLFFKGTRFERLGLSGRFALSQPLTGYNASYYASLGDGGRLVPCSDLTPSTQGGTIDASQVQRCSHPTGGYRTDWSDTWLTLSNPRIYAIPVLDIGISPSLRLTLPSSLQSQFTTLNASIGAFVGLNRVFLKGKVVVGYTFSFSKNFHQYTTARARPTNHQLDPGFVVANGYSLSDISPATLTPNPDTRDVFFGATNPFNDFGMGHLFLVSVSPIEKLSFTVLYALGHGFRYPVSCVADYGNLRSENVCDNGDSVAGASGSALTYRPEVVFQTFSASVGYQFLDWLGASVALITSSPQKTDVGTLRQPFISVDYNAFSAISVGASVSIDKLAGKLF